MADARLGSAGRDGCRLAAASPACTELAAPHEDRNGSHTDCGGDRRDPEGPGEPVHEGLRLGCAAGDGVARRGRCDGGQDRDAERATDLLRRVRSGRRRDPSGRG